MKSFKLLGLWVLLVAPLWGAGVGSATPCLVAISQEGPADDIFVDTSGSQPAIYLSLDGVARQMDPVLTAADLGRLKREREICAQAGGTSPLKLRLPQPAGRPLSRWVVADFNGDGRQDSVYVGTNGLTTQPGVAGTGFGAPTRVTTGPAAHVYNAAAAADVNGDGRPDLIVCCSVNGPDSRTLVLLGNGNLTFAAPLEAAPAVSFALTDWNRDGKPDLISLTPAGTLTFSAGQGNGTFVLQRTTSVPGGQTVLTLDVTGDGLEDALVMDARRLLVYPGQADSSFGNFLATDFYWNQAQTITAGDFTGDGKVDLAVTHRFGMTELLMGDPPLRFTHAGMIAGPQFVRAAAVDLDDAGGAELVMPGAGTTGLQIVPVNALGVGQVNALYGIPRNLTVYPDYDPQRSAVAVADFDQDGRQDVAMLAPMALEAVLQVFSAKGPLPPIAIPAAGNRVSVPQMQAADVTGDGWPDLLMLETESNTLSLFRNLGDGRLTAPVTTALDTPTRSFLLADFNGDSRLDIAFAMGPSPKIQVRYNSGGGTFGATVNIPLSAIPYRLAAGDLNGDFRPDLAYIPLAVSGNLPAGVILNRIDNQWQPPVTLPLKPYGAVGNGNSKGAIQMGDLNIDGFLDILVGLPFNNDAPLVVFRGDGRGGFQAQPHDLSIAPSVADMIVYDADDDGKLDLLAAHCCGDTITRLYYGKGDGTFGLPHPKPIGSHADRIWLGDVTGDGRAELIARTHSGVAVSPFLAGKQLGVSSAASGRGPTVAVDSIVSAYGSNLAVLALGATAINQLELLGTRVSVRDSAGNVANAPLFYISAGQVNFLVPAGLSPGPARVTLQAPNDVLTFAEINLARVAPGLFIVDGSRLVAANVIRVKATGEQIAELPYASGLNGLREVPIDLGPAGENIVLVLYATGVRGRNGLSDVTVTIGGVNAPVAFAGAQNEFPGLDQVNVTIPKSLAGSGSVDVILTVEGQSSNAGRIVIR